MIHPVIHPEYGDNVSIYFRGHSELGLLKVLELVFLIDTPKYWSIDEKKGLILYKTEPSDRDFNVFLVEPTANQLAEMVYGWLKKLPEEEFDKLANDGTENEAYDDGDVHNVRGFNVYNEQWGHIGGMWQAFLAIKPAYIWMGK